MGLKLTNEQLIKLENQIDGVISSMNNQVNDLESVIDMLATQWRGVGAAQFSAAQRDINNYQRNLTNLMGKVREAVEMTRKSNGTNDVGVADAMSRVDVNGAAAGSGMVAAGSYGETGGQYQQHSKLSDL
ncbi:WXG100 family type VII secretion target [Streptomyces pactum]|uniref:WXG100 family type VII secretion target n=1 Tax=Streptomyces pactum TaxID=68249 RepID=A0ABS0NQ26_9ACTN|nr:WXG100 family type VII secretion target [Streptomyces pactum]MBH5337293.1 WXG100 family type VII secretion target [Streptomyces pactum]